MATLKWNRWQHSYGIGGNVEPKYAAISFFSRSWLSHQVSSPKSGEKMFHRNPSAMLTNGARIETAEK